MIACLFAFSSLLVIICGLCRDFAGVLCCAVRVGIYVMAYCRFSLVVCLCYAGVEYFSLTVFTECLFG